MTGREALHQLLETLTDEEVERLLGQLQAPLTHPAAVATAILDARHYPALAEIWDNDDDAVFDELRAG